MKFHEDRGFIWNTYGDMLVWNDLCPITVDYETYSTI